MSLSLSGTIHSWALERFAKYITTQGSEETTETSNQGHWKVLSNLVEVMLKNHIGLKKVYFIIIKTLLLESAVFFSVISPFSVYLLIYSNSRQKAGRVQYRFRY